MRMCCCVLLSLMLALPATAQETRGNISGTVQDSPGIVPGATVTVTNVDTSPTQPLVTNSSGYFEFPLVQPGTYQVSVEMAGYKSDDAPRRPRRRRPAGEHQLRAGSRAGQRADHRDRPVAAARHNGGVIGTELRREDGREPAHDLEHADHGGEILVGRESDHDSQSLVSQGFIDGPTKRPAGPSAVSAANNFTIDGATNSGSDRRLAAFAEQRHDSGDAGGVLELRRVDRTWHGQHDLDDDQGRHQPCRGHRQLSVLDQSKLNALNASRRPRLHQRLRRTGASRRAVRTTSP